MICSLNTSCFSSAAASFPDATSDDVWDEYVSLLASWILQSGEIVRLRNRVKLLEAILRNYDRENEREKQMYRAQITDLIEALAQLKSREISLANYLSQCVRECEALSAQNAQLSGKLTKCSIVPFNLPIASALTRDRTMSAFASRYQRSGWHGRSRRRSAPAATRPFQLPNPQCCGRSVQ